MFIFFYNNSFRSSLAAVKEFEVYLRECASTEDNYVKNLGFVFFFCITTL